MIINSTIGRCAMCGKPTERPIWLDGMAYHSEYAYGSGGPLPQPRPITEEDVRRIVRDEMLAMWRSQNTGAKEIK